MLTSSPSSSRYFYPSLYLSFNNVFQKAVPTQNVNNPVSLPSLLSVVLLLSSPYTDAKTQADRYVYAQTTQVTVLAVLTSAKRKALGPVNLSPKTRSVLISISVTLCSKIVFLWNFKFNFAL